MIVYSVGYNYFRGQQASELFRENLEALVQKASFVGLRNRGSVEEIKRLLSPESASKIVYQPCTTTLIRRIYADILPEKAETGSVAFNVAFDREEMRFGRNKDHILTEIAKAAAAIGEKGHKIYYACHCKDDERFLPYLQAQKAEFEAVPLYRFSPEDVMLFYNGMDTVLGMRGHAQMIPFGLNCGIISLGSHDKMKWFLDDIDAPDWYIELTDPDGSLSERIIEKFMRTQAKDETKVRLIQQQEALWDLTKKNWDSIQALLRT